jgi:hypothetical protein
MDTRRSFLAKVAILIGGAGAGIAPISRSSMLQQLADHLTKIGASICHYSKF